MPYSIEFLNAHGEWESCHGPFATRKDAEEFPLPVGITLPDGSLVQYRIIDEVGSSIERGRT